MTLTQGPTTDATTAQCSPSAEQDRWRELFAAVTQGSARALADLYDVASSQLYGLAMWKTGSADDAADVVATVWVKLAQHRRRLGEVANPKAWLLTVTRRAAVDVLRRRRRERSEPLEAAALVQSSEPVPERQVDAQRASAMLSRLPSKQREVVYLRCFADCTFTEIGAVLGVSRFTAASRYRLAIRRLRSLMEVTP